MNTKNGLIRNGLRLTLVTALAVFGFVSSVSAGLLGVSPGFPLINYDNTGTINISGGLLSVNADPLDIQFTATGSPGFIVAPRSVKIRATVDGGCNVTGGNPAAGPDLEVIGDVFDSNFVLIKSGVLLTGDIVSAGQDATSPPPAFDFRFTNAGGILVTDGDWPTGQDIGITLTSEISSFTGDCSAVSTGGAKGQIGPIAPDVVVDVCDLTLVKTAIPDQLGPFFGSGGDDTDSDSNVDHDGSGDSDDSDSDSEADSADSDAVPLACGCKDRVRSLTMRYNKPAANLVEVRRANGKVLFGPQTLQPGEEFTFLVKGRKIVFMVNMQSVEMLRTGCKTPIGVNQQIGNGDFIVVSGTSKLRNMVPLCPLPGTSCSADHQVTYNYEITNNGTAVDNVVVFDDPLGVIGGVIPNIPGVASAPGNVVTVQATTCIYEDTLNKATATGDQAGVACVSNEAQETVVVLEDCTAGSDTDSDSGIDGNGNGDSDDSDADSGAADCDRDEPRSCFGDGTDTDSDSGKDTNNNDDTDDSDSDSGLLDCDADGK